MEVRDDCDVTCEHNHHASDCPNGTTCRYCDDEALDVNPIEDDVREPVTHIGTPKGDLCERHAKMLGIA